MRAGCDIILLRKNVLLQVGCVIYDEMGEIGIPSGRKIPRLWGAFLRGLHRPGCTLDNSAHDRFRGHRRYAWFCMFLTSTAVMPTADRRLGRFCIKISLANIRIFARLNGSFSVRDLVRRRD